MFLKKKTSTIFTPRKAFWGMLLQKIKLVLSFTSSGPYSCKVPWPLGFYPTLKQ